jgi:ATP-dependent DNA helicase RecQ
LVYSDELVNAAAEVLQRHWAETGEQPSIVVSVPSLRRPGLVPDFALRLAAALGLSYLDALKHITQHPPQSEMRNSYQQAVNIRGQFSVVKQPTGQHILLVDDIVDSKWTLTVLGDLLQQRGSGNVYPFALAATNVSD